MKKHERRKGKNRKEWGKERHGRNNGRKTQLNYERGKIMKRK
jgi:hypothetical protein